MAKVQSMTDDDIRHLALLAGDNGRFQFQCDLEFLVRFANLVIDAHKRAEEHRSTTEGRS